MPKFLFKSSPTNAGTDWVGLIGIFAMQIGVLIMVGAAVISYIDWSSEAAQREFMSTGKPSVSDQPNFANSSAKRCDRRAPL
jgi:hypothetical protein